MKGISPNSTTGHSELEASRRRRAVYSALQPFLHADALATALWAWERYYNRDGDVPVSRFVREICAGPELQRIEREIHRRLSLQMGMPSDRLGPDPWPLMQTRPVPTEEESGGAGRDAATVVFNEVLRYLFDRMDELSPGHCSRVRELLVERLSRTPLQQVALAELSGWLATGEPMSNVRLASDGMREILYLVYVDAREYFGPETADRLMADAGQAANLLPEAREFPANHLL